MAAMNLLLGTLLLAGIYWLGDATDIPVMPNFNNQRIAKAWFPLLSIPTGQTQSVAFNQFRFVARPKGNLKYTFRAPQNGECKTEEMMLNKEGRPGYYVTSGEWGIPSLFHPDLLPGEFSCWAGKEEMVFCPTGNPEFLGQLPHLFLPLRFARGFIHLSLEDLERPLWAEQGVSLPPPAQEKPATSCQHPAGECKENPRNSNYPSLRGNGLQYLFHRLHHPGLRQL